VRASLKGLRDRERAGAASRRGRMRSELRDRLPRALSLGSSLSRYLLDEAPLSFVESTVRRSGLLRLPFGGERDRDLERLVEIVDTELASVLYEEERERLRGISVKSSELRFRVPSFLVALDFLRSSIRNDHCENDGVELTLLVRLVELPR